MGVEVKDVGRSISWGALLSFLTHLPPDSALSRELDPESSAWYTTAKTNLILADLFDILATINGNMVAIARRKAARKIDPYPRPGARHKNAEHIVGELRTFAEINSWITDAAKERRDDNG